MLADRDCFIFGFYWISLALPDVPGAELIRILRRRTNAGIVAAAEQLSADAFTLAVTAGADMCLSKPLPVNDALLALMAIQRRCVRAFESAQSWQLDHRAGALIAPDGSVIPLTAADMALMDCFLARGDDPVPREALRHCLRQGGVTPRDDAMNACVYRLRRRIELATQRTAPLRAQHEVGYVFKELLRSA
ncbi:winged helix-turn-helix domain-containing protein [Aquincola sp. J276]|uniref:winged helix-turn-helix domain-containing protein n=1 Tax=Aquincola sp. J276 TaxID=2898432 RepID=UPI002151FB49|nr:winged helix-turn-helix domain-containing protein [Aquincola sp. J276]MCR5868165.1 winged helix-turn-helix domain-containing protein [Aquincola sp. J276]